MALSKLERRNRIKNRIRKIVSGNETKPRLTVFRSNKYLSKSLSNDVNGTTLVSASSREKGISKGTNIEVANAVGKLLAEKATKAGVGTCTFDRNGYLYHGRVKSLAEGVREGGLKF